MEPGGWDVAFGGLEAGTFVRRLSRFHALVELGGAEALAHVPNSGRLRELLCAGREVRLAPRPGPRRTAYDLVLARVDRGAAAGWACLDARLPPRVVAAAAARGAVPTLRGFELAAFEPRLGTGRADLLYRGPDGELVAEAKSITLVRGGAALFPDCVTARGAGHVLALAAAAARGGRALVAFVVQREDARALRINEPADPAFARALRHARRAGVAVAAGACRVSEHGIRWERALPLEAYDPAAPVTTLPDHVPPGLRVLFCGLNPGHYSAWWGMYYAQPGNLFWEAARRAALVPPSAGPGDEAWLPGLAGVGFTDLVKRPTRSIAELAPAEWEAGAARLRSLLRERAPRALCVVGLRAARALLGPGARPGPQREPVEGVPTFAVPSTSGRQAAYGRREVVAWFRALAAWLPPPDGR